MSARDRGPARLGGQSVTPCPQPWDLAPARKERQPHRALASSLQRRPHSAEGHQETSDAQESAEQPAKQQSVRGETRRFGGLDSCRLGTGTLLLRRISGPLDGVAIPAHFREGGLGLPVFLLLGGPGLLQQFPELSVLRVVHHHLLHIPNAVGEVFEAVGRLCSSVQCLGVRGVFLQDGFRGFLGITEVVHLEIASGSVQLARLLQLLGLLLEFLWEILEVTEDLHHLGIATQRELCALGLEEIAANVLPTAAILDLLIVRHVPHCLACHEIDQLDCQHCFINRCVTAEPRVEGNVRPARCDQSTLALLHLFHRVLQRLTHLPVAECEVKRSGFEACQGLLTVGGSLHFQVHLCAFPRSLVALAFSYLLLCHRAVFSHGYVLELVNF
mmetsp:Transcript_8098/g.22381  ORF Transcript_8098/g.22381 Transcript_8098/m.22381 type:complete len:387 (+) Transcript_8098:165-1325(+)